MTDIADLVDRYFVGPDDADEDASQPMPQTFEGSKITPVIDLEAYNAELAAALTAVEDALADDPDDDAFVYLTNWYFGLTGTVPPYTLDMGPDEDDYQDLLSERLKSLAAAGCDVRVIAWVSGTLFEDDYIALLPGAGGTARMIRDLNVITLRSLHDLRSEPALEGNAIAEVISHPGASLHAKTVAIGSSNGTVGFTGGVNFSAANWGRPKHEVTVWWKDSAYHDVMAKVEGPAVQGLYDNFRELWNESTQRTLTTYAFGPGPAAEAGEDDEDDALEGSGSIIEVEPLADSFPRFMLSHVTRFSDTCPERELDATPVGSYRVQSLRTIPQFNYSYAGNIGPSRRPISYAPRGCFEYRLAWRKAILAAERLIFIEDQFFYSEEVLGWVNEAVKDHSDLRVVLVVRGDAGDVPSPGWLYRSVNEGLLAGLTDDQRDQIGLFRNDSSDGGLFIHSKTTIVDDHWAVIGSGNCARRSLYTDIEHSMSFIDEEGQGVAAYRAQLWADHFAHPDPDDLLPLDAALHAWNPQWGTAGGAPSRPSHLVPLSLPLDVDAPVGEFARGLSDFDSRERWGLLGPLTFLE